MKKLYNIILIVLIFSACKEQGPFIDFTPKKVKLPGDTDYFNTNLPIPQLHNILLEDITGVKCPNCPNAHVVAKNISDANPGRIVIAALHPSSFGFTDQCWFTHELTKEKDKFNLHDLDHAAQSPFPLTLSSLCYLNQQQRLFSLVAPLFLSQRLSYSP